MINGDKPRFCAGVCPNVPADLVVDVDAARQPEFGESWNSANICRLICVVAKSKDPDTPVGALETFEVASNGKTPSQIEDDIRQCTSPKVGRVAKALGSRGTCPAVQFAE